MAEECQGALYRKGRCASVLAMLPMLPCAEAMPMSAGHLQPRPVRVGPRGSGPIAYGSPFPPLRALAMRSHRDEGLGCASSISPSAGIEQRALAKDHWSF